MRDWPDSLNEAWRELEQITPVSREYRSRLLTRDIFPEVLAGMRAADNAPCLMLQTNLTSEAHFELGGMRLTSVPDDRGPLLILSLEDRNRRDLFTTICADVVSAAAIADRNSALKQFLARLDAWRQFLRDRHKGLSRPETVGLIGELLVLECLLGFHSDILRTWQSPTDGLHDFVADGHALEVKTGLGPSSTITISRLDQLDSTQLYQLNLVHVRLIEAANGRPLGDIIRVIRDQLPSEADRRAFENALLRRGLLPDDEVARTAPTIQVRTFDTYAVTDGFPQLRRASLPSAIVEASYTLEIRSIHCFLTDTSAVFAAFNRRDD